MRQLDRPDELSAVAAQHAAFVLDAFGAADFELDLKTNTLRHSPRLNALFGYPAEHPLTVVDCMARFHPDDRPPGEPVAAAILDRDGPRFQEEFRLLLPGSAVRWVLARGEICFDETGRPAVMRGAALDITERKHQEVNSAFLAEIMADFAPLKAADDITRVAGAKTAAHFGLSRCVFVEINEAVDEARVIYDRCEHDLPSLVGSYRLVDFHTDEERRRLAAGGAIVINDVADETRTPVAADRFAQLQIGALVNASYVSNGRWQFVLSAMQDRPRHWRPDEVELLRELSARIWPRIARARAEEALRESERRYRTLIDSIDQAFALVELLYDQAGTAVDYRFLQVNHTFERHSGLSDVVGRSIRELLPNVEAQWVAVFARVAATGETYHVETDSPALGRWFEVEAVRVGAPEQRQVAIVFTDISVRKQANADVLFLSLVGERIRVCEDADELLDGAASLLGEHLHAARCFFATLDEPQERWRVRHEHHTAGLPPLAGEYRDSSFSRSLLAMLRTGKNVHSDDTALDERTAPSYECCFAHAGLRALAAVRLRYDAGRLDVIVAAADAPRTWSTRELVLLDAVAERVWNAVERLRLAAAQRAYASRLQQLNAASLLLNSAPTRAAVLRLTAEQARHLLGAHLAVAHANDEQQPLGALDEASFSERYARWQGQAELPAWAAVADGPSLPGGIAAPLVGRDGRTIGLIQLFDKDEGAFSADDQALLVQLAQVAAIALENRQLYAQEQAARAQAEQASRLKDDFLATVSHELRTPLTAFLGYGQLLQRRRRDEADVARMLDLMMQSARAQAVLIEDLLDVSRIVNGKLRISPRPVLLGDVIEAALDTVRPTVEAKRLQLQVQLDPAASLVQGDPNRLQQVVWNLISNAAKFTPSDGQIVVELVRTGGCAELSVRDSGQGIKADFMPHVFERFRQADSSSHRAHGGLGLGLAIVRHLVELHGGAVEAASAGPGQGATFTVRLPLLDAGDPPAVAPSPRGEQEPCKDQRPLGGLRVLVVDDQPPILGLLSEILLSEGAEVLACASAREALAQLRVWRPHALISDIAMPDEDGYWLIRQVRALPAEAGGATPALALTAYVRLEDRLQVLEAGFQQYLPKPVEHDELRDVVLRLVAG